MKRILFCLIAFCATLLTRGSDIYFRHLDVKDGLSQITIYSVYQDEIGAMWFGSSEGLNRYNGESIEIFRPSQNNQGLTNNEINAICGNRKGMIYLRSIRDLIKFDLDKETFTCIEQDCVNAMFCQGDTLWIAGRNDISYYLESDQKLHKLVTVEDVTFSGAALYVDDEFIWTSTSKGILAISRKNPQEQKIVASVDNGYCFCKDSKGNFWIGSWSDGIYRIAPDGTVFHYSRQPGTDGLSDNQIRTIMEDDNGMIWAGTFYGLNKFDPKTGEWKHYTRQDNISYGLSHNSVLSLYKDMQGTIWIGTYYGGVNYFNPKTNICRFYGASSADGNYLSFPFVGKMAEDATHNLWICTEGGGLNCLDRKTQKFSRYLFRDGESQSIGHNNLKCIYYRPDKNWLYIGTHTGGLSIFDIDQKRFRTLRNQEGNPNSLPHNIVNDIQPYKDGLAVLTQAGLFRMDLGTELFSPLSADTAVNRVLMQRYKYETFLIDRHNRLWLAVSDGGVVCVNLDTDQVTHYNSEAGNPASIGKFRVVSIYEDSRGDVFFGTIGSGLFKFLPKSSSFRKYSSENNELPGDYCYYIKESPKFHHLIVLHNKGVSLFDPETGSSVRTYDFFRLGFNQGSSVYFTDDDEAFIGGVNGLVAFYEQELYTTHADYRMFFDKLYIHNKEVLPDDGSGILAKTLAKTAVVELSYNQNNIIIEFSTSNYAREEDVMYEYRLEGFDKNWIPAISNQIAYTNLSPGKYKLVVRAVQKNEKSVHQVALDIHITPPFYATNLAYVFYLLAFASLMYLIIHVKTRQARLRTSLEYERKEKERIEELNQVKLRFFTNISHEFRTPLTLIIGQIEFLLQLNKLSPAVYNRVLRIYKNAWHMRDLISELLDFRKQEQGYLKLKVENKDIVSFTKEIYMCFYEYSLKRHISYKFESVESEIELWFDPVQLQKVIFNLLSNAFKYTPQEGRIGVTIKKNSGQVVILVEDDGAGIPEESIHKIFERFYQTDNQSTGFTMGTGIGLALSKGIVELHKGTIDVESMVGKGTAFMVTLLLGNRHFTPEELMPRKAGEKEETHEAMPIELPILPQATDVDSRQAVADPVAEDPDNRPAILIVEDNEEMLDMLTDIFTPIYNVHLARNGKEGLEMAQQIHPDIVLSDVMMPEMSGKEMCYKIKNNVELSHIPVVLLTAQTSAEYTVEGFMFGADDYITKPFNVKVLIARCNNLIKSRKQLMERLRGKQSEEISVSDTINEYDKMLIDKAVRIVKENFENPEFDMNKLAAELGMGRSKLYLKIKEVTGLTPNEFTLKIKLDEAMRLLTTNLELNVSEISYRLGFSSARYFSRCFKAFYGTAPQNVRKGTMDKKEEAE